MAPERPIELRPLLRKPAKPANAIRVLVVEDVPTMALTVQSILLQASMEVELAATGAEAWERKLDFCPDIAVIDLGLPDVLGFELIERFAQAGDCGIILLRIYIDPAQRCLIGNGGERTALTEAEMSALDTLLDAAGNSVSREWLSRIALKRPLHADDRAVDQLVMKLRRKLASQGASDRVILSARRQGYVIADPSLFRAVPRTAPANSNGTGHINGAEAFGAE